MVRRVVGAVALTAVAVTHAAAIFASGPLPHYLIFAMILTAVAAVAAAGALIRSGRLIIWRTAGTLTAVALLGYTVDHTVGLPGSGQGIGHGVAPLGLASVGLELLVLALAAVAIARWDD